MDTQGAVRGEARGVDKPNDEQVREASDPTTPGERLRVIHDTSLREIHALGGTGNRRGSLYLREARERMRAVLRNPALPTDLLGQALLRFELAAWYNPQTPRLLESEPCAGYHEAARRLLGLHIREGETYDDMSIEGIVARAQRRSPEMENPGDRDLARHFAFLFDLPWPKEA